MGGGGGPGERAVTAHAFRKSVRHFGSMVTTEQLLETAFRSFSPFKCVTSIAVEKLCPRHSCISGFFMLRETLVSSYGPGSPSHNRVPENSFALGKCFPALDKLLHSYALAGGQQLICTCHGWAAPRIHVFRPYLPLSLTISKEVQTFAILKLSLTFMYSY